MFKFSNASLKKLEGVHPDLVRVCRRAIELTIHDFKITEGLRSKERQAQLVKEGKSQTLKSRHLGGFAIDFAVIIGGTVVWDFPFYRTVADAFKKASKELNVPIIWGGDWKTFKDGPHVELDKNFYPDK